MLKHLLLYSIITDFIGALGVLHFSSTPIRAQVLAVALERFDFVHLHPAGAGRIYFNSDAINNLLHCFYVPRYVRSANGGINPASFVRLVNLFGAGTF